LDEAKKRIRDRYKEIGDAVGEMVAVGAVKYALLKSGIGRDIRFDFEESINIQGNSGPYLQYTYARTQSVLAKAKRGNVILSRVRRGEGSQSKRNDTTVEEVAILRAIHRFPEVVEEAGEKFAPNILCNYLFDLTQKFNLFYQKHKIIGSDNQDFRLSLTSATGIVLKNGLKLLSIQTPVKM